MQASELISSSIISIDPDDNGRKAITLMDDMRISHLPIVKNKIYFGLISENEILQWDSTKDQINKHLTNLMAPYVMGSQHLFDIIEVLEANNLTAVPVLDNDKQYLGTISDRRLLLTIAKSSAIQDIGGIIVLEMNHNDYSMGEISSIIESNNTKILSSYITSTPESTKMELTIKVNVTEVDNIIADLKRFEYNVMASYNDSNNTNDDIMERYESLMRYLGT
jgi:predicted transcriptional regulator